MMKILRKALILICFILGFTSSYGQNLGGPTCADAVPFCTAELNQPFDNCFNGGRVCIESHPWCHRFRWEIHQLVAQLLNVQQKGFLSAHVRGICYHRKIPVCNRSNREFRLLVILPEERKAVGTEATQKENRGVALLLEKEFSGWLTNRQKKRIEFLIFLYSQMLVLIAWLSLFN